MMCMDFTPHDKPLPPVAMRVYKALRSRKVFTEEDKALYVSAKRGYDGELKFYHFLKEVSSRDPLLLHSLSLESNNSKFQIDSLLLNDQSIYLFEVKNFSGDYYIRNNNWYARSGNKEINNPFIQLKRSESLLRQLLSSLNISYSIIPYVVFINSEFTLFNASMNLPLLFHSQLRRFFHRDFFQRFPPSETDRKIATLLTKQHKEDVRPDLLPQYTFDELRKGVKCSGCEGFMELATTKTLKCNFCGVFESIDKGVLRAIDEFCLLFPQERITTSTIAEWCNILSKRTIRRVLSKFYQRNGNGKATYYTFKE